jgi:hypothetical protein
VQAHAYACCVLVLCICIGHIEGNCSKWREGLEEERGRGFAKGQGLDRYSVT